MFALALSLAGCGAVELVPSIWPPADFVCEVEEVALRDGVAAVVRRMRVDATGLVVYGTAARSLVDATTGIALPVMDRLAIYQLVPACVRAFARDLDRLGLRELDSQQGERGATEDSGLVLRWQAFGSKKVVVARGRVHGPMAAILAVVAAHLPAGERFAVAAFADRPVVSVLRGVPEPLTDGRLALQALESLLAKRPDAGEWLLDAFALACAGGTRATAEAALRRWETWVRDRQAMSPFPDQAPTGLTAEVLWRWVPPQ